MNLLRSLGAAVAISAAAFGPTAANAALSVCFDAGSNGSWDSCIVDGAGGDNSALAGKVSGSYAGLVTFDVTGVATGTGAFLGGYGIDLGSSGPLTGLLTVGLFETNLSLGGAGPQLVSFGGEFTGVSAGIPTYALYVDDANRNGAVDAAALATLIDSGGAGDIVSGSALLSNPFSLSALISYNGGTGTTVSSDLQVKMSVPEPSSIALTALGLLAAGLASRRSRAT